MTVGVVTGAAQGMGRACAERLLDLVDTLVLVDRDEALLESTATELAQTGGRASLASFPLDITDVEGVKRLGSTIAAAGELRALAHVAGVSPAMAEWQQVLVVDLVATARLTEMAFPLARAGTALVCFGSIAPFLAPGDVDPALDAVLDDPLNPAFLDRIHEVLGEGIENSGLAYLWAKRGVHRLVRREAIRFGRIGARVCSVSPGIIDTAMGRLEAAAGPTNDLLVERTPLGRQGRPGEVAAVTAFLLSEEASYVNGIDLLVDGGTLASLNNPEPGTD